MFALNNMKITDQNTLNRVGLVAEVVVYFPLGSLNPDRIQDIEY